MNHCIREIHSHDLSNNYSVSYDVSKSLTDEEIIGALKIVDSQPDAATIKWDAADYSEYKHTKYADHFLKTGIILCIAEPSTDNNSKSIKIAPISINTGLKTAH